MPSGLLSAAGAQLYLGNIDSRVVMCLCLHLMNIGINSNFKAENSSVKM